MSSILDLSPKIQEATAGPQPGEQRQIPATFDEAFPAYWNEFKLFSMSVMHQQYLQAAREEYIDTIESKTGQRIPPIPPGQDKGDVWGYVGRQVEKLRAQYPDLNLPQQPDDAGLEARGQQLSAQARAAYHVMAQREKTAGGTFAAFLGGLLPVTDPVNLLSAPLGGGEAGVLMTGLKIAGVGAGAQLINEAVAAQPRELVEPGYAASGEPQANILMTGAGGFVLGAGTKALGNVWGRLKTGTWPTSVRDAGNVLESEAHVMQTNAYPGVAGEAAHRNAISAAIDNILREEPVSIEHIITPEIEASSRNLMTRLEGERGMALPIYDERTTLLISEEAGLRERDSQLQSQLQSVGEPSPEAASRLAAVRTLEQQMEAAKGSTERNALARRRDELLADTTPEQLHAQAAPQELQRTVTAERAAIERRLQEIGEERARIEAQQRLSPEMRAPAMGQTQPARLVPFERVRAVAAELSEAAKAEAAAAPAPPAAAPAAAPPEPKAPTTAAAKAETATEALRSSVRQVAASGGHILTEDEVKALAERFAKMTPEEAANKARQLKAEPRALLAEPAQPPREAGPRPAGPAAPTPTPAESVKILGTPEEEATLRASIDREMAAAVAAREITSSDLKARFTGPDNTYDNKAADAYVRGEVQAALDAGQRVTIEIEGKTKRIVEVGPLGLKDTDGNSWGMLGFVMQKPGEEARIRISKPVEVMVPTVTKEGTPTMKSLDALMEDVNDRQKAAQEIQACAAQQQAAE